MSIWAPLKDHPVNPEDLTFLKEETSTICHSDDDHEDIALTKEDTYYYEQSQPQMTSQLVSQLTRAQNHKLKNELCRNYLRTGFCPYNDKCQFAHGTTELRQNLDHNARYKTKKCLAFFRDCYCVYGERCNFLHSQPAPKQDSKWKLICKNYRQLLAQTRQSSRLFPVAAAHPN